MGSWFICPIYFNNSSYIYIKYAYQICGFPRNFISISKFFLKFKIIAALDILVSKFGLLCCVVDQIKLFKMYKQYSNNSNIFSNKKN